MPRDVVVFPDAVAVTTTYLREQLADRDSPAHVGRKVPTERPPLFITVRRAGGVRQTVVSDRPLLIVECWADSDEAAHDLAQLCRALLHAMAGTTQSGVPVYRVDDAGGVIDLPDPVSTQSRFTFTVQAHLRGAAE